MGDSLKSLSDDSLKALLEITAKPVRSGKLSADFTPTCECGTVLDNGYCRNDSCPEDAPEETFPCEHCGHCSSPGQCVQSYTCPRCGSPQSTLCKEGTRLVGFHTERWALVNV